MTPEEAAPIHRRLFTEFCRVEMAAGGPDPQVKLTGNAVRLRQGIGPELSGLFVVPYSCAGAAILWRLWEKKSVHEWLPWLQQHGSTIPVRKERRPVKGSWPRFITCATSWLQWCEGSYEQMKDRSYAEMYKSVTDDVKYFGRYATMKLLETMYQAGLVEAAQNTMVPRDAKFPRRTMALLMPEHADLLAGKRDDAEVDALCDRIRLSTSDRIGQEISWFQIETMLCIYRQSLSGKYPAGRHDSELGHWTKTMDQLPVSAVVELQDQFPFLALRADLYPHEYLGEWGDPKWSGIRPELEEERLVMLRAMGVAR